MAKRKLKNGMRIEKPRPYRIVLTSDWHCGASTGLTNMDKDYGKSELVLYQDRRDELWRLFIETIREISPFDELWIVGDAINGPGNRQAKRDNLVNVLEQQVVMAYDVLMGIAEVSDWNGTALIVEGTEWHTGDGQAEHDVAKMIGQRATKGKIIERAGIMVDVRHFTGGSSKPHTFGNALVSEYNAAVANANQHGTPVPDLIVRAHRHMWARRDGVALRSGKKKQWSAIGLPALQAWGSDYAKKISGGLYPDVGFVHLDIIGDSFEITPHLFHLRSQVPR